MNDICYNCSKKSIATGKLDKKELKELELSCCQINFKKGDKIIVQDSPSYHITFIKEGLVKMHVMGPEKEQILKIVKGPAYLGIPTTIGAKINEYSATAISESDVCFIGFDVFKNSILNNGEFAYEIIVELSKNNLQFYKKYINQVQKQGPGKIAETLLYFSEKIFDQQHDFKLPLSRNELGDLTCTSRETVSRILSDFSNNKIIKVKKNYISILNKKQLEAISKLG